MTQQKRVLTGTRPSGRPHLGNYFGAYAPAIALQDDYELFFFLADFHALNSADTPEHIREQSLDIAATMLACGLNPEKSCFYTQSSVPEVCELAWILGCQTPYGMMLRAHSFKDAQAKGIEVNMGVFNYPILMAADILMFDVQAVPVGQDQKQHLEMTRDMAQRFNHRYGEVLTIPEPLISEQVGVVPGVDGEKMSKSKHNVIAVFGSDKEWKTSIMSIKTDSKGLDEKKDPDSCNVFALYKLVASDDEIAQMATRYRTGGYGYGHAKQALLEAVKARFSPMRERYHQYIARPDDLCDILQAGAKRARLLAEKKLEQIQQHLGVIGRANLLR